MHVNSGTYEELNSKVNIVGEINDISVELEKDDSPKRYHFILAVKRLSDAIDYIPVVMSAKKLKNFKLVDGAKVICQGYMSGHYNKKDDFFDIHVICKKIIPADSDDGKENNVITMNGEIYSAPSLYETHYGRIVTSFRLAMINSFTDKATNKVNHRREIIPCISWGSSAKELAKLQIGDEISVTGRLQYRAFNKGDSLFPEEKKTYEVSINEYRIKHSDSVVNEIVSEEEKNFILEEA